MTSGESRVIIALDLDAFYVSASRKRDPSLIGLPVGIKQKGILATVSYEARALGVKKLASIRDGVTQCPEMVLVNGEDLSYFRQISMQVFKLVSSMIWQGRVEKLGMDELFCDCTEMIDAQMADWGKSANQDTLLNPIGFILPVKTEEKMHNNQAHTLPRQTIRLFLATHLAQQIRSRVADEIGLTSSAGIASSKLVAKIVGNTHKPNHQTVFASSNKEDTLLEIQRFLDPYPLRSLNGFGSVIVEKLCTHASKTVGHEEKDFPSGQLTVSLARQIFDWQSLVDIFGQRLGTRLYNLLQGNDDEPVIKAPEYPAQISIEDTYRGLEGAALLKQILILSESLLRRLETEILDSEGQALTAKYNLIEKPVVLDQILETSVKVRDYQELMAEKKEGRYHWKRYPLTVRLSIRQGWDNRISRQGKMPVEVFDLSLSRKERAQILTQNLESILKSIFASEGNKGQGLNLINIAALDLSPNRPSRAIGGYFKNGSPVKEERTSISSMVRELPSIDLAFLRELPAELRAEVAREYNITLDDLDEEEGVDSVKCQWCDQLQNSWLQHDHTRWPQSGLPPSTDDAVDWVIESDDEQLSHGEDRTQDASL